jgi:hypothetical protein
MSVSTCATTYISNYSFGRVTINGRSYCSDLLITCRGGRDQWRRRTGHSLCVEDLHEILQESPDILVVGTGLHGRMQIPQATELELSSRGIEIRCLRTTEAVAEFNRLQQRDASVAAALHLTC